MAESPIEVILSRLQSVKKQGSGYQARCPAHEDKHASLSLNECDDGKCLIYCHAGCKPATVLAAMSLELKDLYPRASPSTQRSDKVYPYTDTHGKTLYEVVRFVPKAFRQRVPKPGGGYSWSMKGVNRVLYKLPDIISAINSDVPIFIVEGEKDVHSLARIWTSATCNAGGAGKWRDSYSKSLTGARVVILPDNDEPGKAHARMVARSLRGYAKSVRVLELPNLPPKGDVSDWIAAGGTREQLMELAASAACNRSNLNCQLSTDNCQLPLTDLGNAERLIAAHGSNLRYNEDSGKWLVWNARYWQPDNTGEVDRLAREVVRGMADEIKALCDRLKDAHSDEERKALQSRIEDMQKHMHNSESRYKLDAMVKLACHCPGVPVLSNKLDSDAWLLNCANGTIDLQTGKLKPHAQADLITKMVAVDYDPEVECPRWEQCLAEVFLDDADIVAFAKRMAGYVLTGDTREESLFILTGKGQNGKTRFVETLRAILGDYSRDTPIATFTERREANSFDLPALAGARLVTAAEGESNQAFNESLLKRLTGGDPITCCFKFKDYFTYTPAFKVLLSTNEIPRTKSQNFAMKRRLKLIPFRQRFYDPEDGKQPVKDTQLKYKLLAELPGILRWMVEGCLEWRDKGLDTPPAVRREVDKLFEEQDPLGEFIESECILEPCAEVEVKRLWDAYQKWCEANGRRSAFMQAQWFSRSLTQRDGIDSRKGTGGNRMLIGIKLLGDPDQPPFTGLSGESGENQAFPETFHENIFCTEEVENAQNTPLSPLSSVETDS